MAIFAATGASASAANLVQNPSFELGAFVNRGDGFQILPLGSNVISDWSVVNDSIAWGTLPNSAAGVNPVTPFEGDFFLDLQGDGLFSAPFGGVAQTLATVSGQRYRFSFYLGTEQSPGSPATHGPISVAASAGSTSLPFTYDPGGTGTQWGEVAFEFVAEADSTPISIVGTSTTGGAYIGLDLISVTAVVDPGCADGDTDDDCDVDLDDLNNVRNNFGSVGTPVLGDATPRDGDVDLDDLNAVRNNFGAGGPTPVPEPSAFALLALGAAAMVARRRTSSN